MKFSIFSIEGKGSWTLNVNIGWTFFGKSFSPSFKVSKVLKSIISLHILLKEGILSFEFSFPESSDDGSANTLAGWSN